MTNAKDPKNNGKNLKKRAQHPDLREVVYMDSSTGATFMIKSAAESAETIVWEDGREYPLVKVEISSHSHPAFTGKLRETTGPKSRSEAFRRKYAH